ncbi:MAG: S-methyl-5'-thioadenosine phosphorylase [Planctomycetaceae bacterium]|nr:S-methyl-5'-thioadenosine phosphorylase [Planctomycetaceae bacterium]
MAKVGIIGGSGLGDALLGQTKGTSVEMDTPFGKPSDAIVQTAWQGVDIAIINRHGSGHMINPSRVNYRANIYALKALGCTHVIASGAVGSLREQIAPKHLVIPDQVIDKTFRREQTFYDDLAAHLEFAAPFCPVLRKHLLGCAPAVKTTVHDGGCYVCMEGPAFSTRAESEMHRLWGGDLIGMTAMPEAKLAREAEMAYALVCLPSDYDCWRPAPQALDKHELLKEIIGNLTQATANAIELIKAAVASFKTIADIPSPSHTAMEMAVWSDRSRISPEARKRYGVLIGRYL